MLTLRNTLFKIGKSDKTKYMLISNHQNAGKNHDIKIASRCFENVVQLKYFGNDSNKSKFDWAN
jgi:hypothetical protein